MSTEIAQPQNWSATIENAANIIVCLSTEDADRVRANFPFADYLPTSVVVGRDPKLRTQASKDAVFFVIGDPAGVQEYATWLGCSVGCVGAVDMTDGKALVGAMESATHLEPAAPPTADERDPQQPAPENWLAHFTAGTVTATELQTIELPHHSLLLDRWLAEGDLGFIFAKRGVGKTYLCIGLARALSEGGTIGPWRVRLAVPVLCVDGEMNSEQIRERDAALAGGEGKLYYLNHELLFHRTEKTLNLSHRKCQDALTQHAIALGVRVLILDNLSTLFSGVAENDNDAWEIVLPWLLQLRRLGIAVIIVAHAGRNGHMRGASRREDCAAWVLRLDDALDAATEKRGAKFVSMFTKPSRHTAAEVPPYEWEFITDATTGRCQVKVSKANGLEVFLQWVANGLDSCTDIATEMETSRGTVSKLAKKAEKDGLIRIERRKYVLTGNEAPE